MSLDGWLTYVTAVTVLSLIPGPSVFMAISQALSKGLGASFHSIVGNLLGGIVMMTIAYIGLGTILASSSEIYSLIKWAGVCYMAWMGLSQIHEAKCMDKNSLAITASTKFRAGSLQAGFLIGVLNPKAILFYVSFLAQFMNPDYAMTPQFVILMATSAVVVFIVLGGYALLAGQARKTFQSLRARKRMGYTSGSFLLGGSALMASN